MALGIRDRGAARANDTLDSLAASRTGNMGCRSNTNPRATKGRTDRRSLCSELVAANVARVFTRRRGIGHVLGRAYLWEGLCAAAGARRNLTAGTLVWPACSGGVAVVSTA